MRLKSLRAANVFPREQGRLTKSVLEWALTSLTVSMHPFQIKILVITNLTR